MSSLIDGILVLAVQNGWLAVDKPCGLSVHNDPGHDLSSVLADKIKTEPSLANRLGITSSLKIQPVHRLDKETSGVILFATKNDILRNLSELFMNGQVKKKYLALVHGCFNQGTIGKEYQNWDFPLTKSAGGRNNPAGSGKRVACTTRYRIIQQSLHYSLLDIVLLTGRKHQIRRHAKLSGHPVAGDTRYGSKKSITYLKNIQSFQRLGLHCHQLEFVPPGQKKAVCISSQNPLTNMIQLLKNDCSEVDLNRSVKH